MAAGRRADMDEVADLSFLVVRKRGIPMADGSGKSPVVTPYTS
jgi:hypothetical protein